MMESGDSKTLSSIFSAAGALSFSTSGALYEAQSQYLASVIAESNDTPLQLSGSQRSDSEVAASNSKRGEESQRVQLIIADQARRLAEHLDRQIAALESAFLGQHGDAWREHIANRVMDADDIPQRRDGESMKDYRERLETVLIATMIDPATGEIRPEYADSDDPDIRRYSDWAHLKHRKNEIEFAPPNELKEILARPANRSDLNFAAQVSGNRNAQAQEAELSDAANRQRDDVASASTSELDGFLPGS